VIRIQLVDDHAVVRTGFRLLIEAHQDMSVIGESESGEEAYRQYCEIAPDVVIIDLAMPGMGGLEAIKRIKSRDEHARILALSAHDDPIHARRALDEGSLGFLSKRGAPEALIAAILQTADGQRYIDATLANELDPGDMSAGARSPLDRLSVREFDVFLRLARGDTVQRIAKDLSLSSSTVGTHLYNVKQKLDVENQSEHTLIAIRHNLIEV